MKYTVDRIEGEFAVCEDENCKMCEFKIDVLPEGIKEGDVFSGNSGEFQLLTDEAEARKKRIADLKKKLYNKNN